MFSATLAGSSGFSWSTSAMCLRRSASLHRPQVVAVEQQRPAGRVVEARQEVQQRALADPAGPDERDHLAPA